jgi:hypothetical protein
MASLPAPAIAEGEAGVDRDAIVRKLACQGRSFRKSNVDRNRFLPVNPEFLSLSTTRRTGATPGASSMATQRRMPHGNVHQFACENLPDQGHSQDTAVRRSGGGCWCRLRSPWRNCTGCCKPPWAGTTVTCTSLSRRGNTTGIPTRNADFEVIDERKVRLDSLLINVRNSLVYEYDFGDSWEHKIDLEKILPADPEMTLPKCIKCVRACPPEDVGGVWGYAGFLAAMADPEHPEHEYYKEWIGEGFDPVRVDIDRINARLADLK